jgi:hypothetical protein
MEEHLKEARNCGDCGVKPGELHGPGCDVERCPNCGGQLISCDCDPDDEIINGLVRMPWTGEWPGLAECREYGFWCIRTPSGLVECDASTPGATEDLNRLGATCRWNRALKKWVKSWPPDPAGGP